MSQPIVRAARFRPFSFSLCLLCLLSLSLPLRARSAGSAADAPPGAGNLARGCAYRVASPEPDAEFAAKEARYPDTGGRELTDGVLAAPGAPYTDPAWTGWARQERRVITLDLGRLCRVRDVRLFAGADDAAGIGLPEAIVLAFSPDGRRWTVPVAPKVAVSPAPAAAEMQTCVLTAAAPAAPQTARYVQVRFDVSIWVFLQEVAVDGEPIGGAPAVPAAAAASALDAIVAERRGLLVPPPVPAAVGWLKPGSAAAGGARHIVLMYTNRLDDPAHSLGPDHYLPYVAYVDRAGKPQDTLFDTFLFLPSVRTSPRDFGNGPSAPSTQADWQGLLDQFFEPGHQLAALDRAAETAGDALKRRIRPRVILAIPYPSPRQKDFGVLPGESGSADFSDPVHGADRRLAAVRAYIAEAFTRWRAAHFRHLDLIGFYWHAESVSGPADRSLLPAVAAQVHAGHQRLFWIPYYQAAGARDWKKLGFDAAMMQPNLSFSNVPAEKNGDRLQSAADIAARYGLGLEIELHWTLTDPLQRARYHAYLDWGRTLGYRDRALLSYYQSVDSLRAASASPDPEIRALYDDTYAFIHGK